MERHFWEDFLVPITYSKPEKALCSLQISFMDSRIMWLDKVITSTIVF